MNKNRNRILALLIAATVLFTTGCSSVADYAMERNAAVDIAEAPTGYYEEGLTTESYAEMEDSEVYADEMAKEIPATGGGGDASYMPVENPTVSGGAPLTKDRKLVINSNLTLETKEFDAGIAKIEALAKEFGGYLESSDIQGTNMLYKNSPRYAHFNVRIPSSGSEDFIEKLSGDFHVVSTSQYTQDITESYFDTEARLNSLLEQEKRLQGLLEADGDLEYLLQLETALANIRYQIDAIYNQLKNMDSQVDFSTVNINISEVIEYDDVEKLNDPFGVRVNRAFSGSWKNFVEAVKNAIIVVISLLPFIVLLLIILVIIIIIARRSRKKAKTIKTLPNPPQAAPPIQDPPNTFEQTHSNQDKPTDK